MNKTLERVSVLTLTAAIAATFAAPAFAATVQENGHTLVKSSFTENGKPAYTPYTFAAKDPNSGVMTTFVPIYYLMQILESVPVKNTWNGHVWHLNTTFGGNLSIKGTKGKDSITLTGRTLETGVPAFALKDPNSGKVTTFFGLFYAEKLLDEQGLPSTWNGKTHVFNVKVPLPGQNRVVINTFQMQKVKPGTEVSSTTWSSQGVYGFGQTGAKATAPTSTTN